ncbi:MFS general substrate transporter [Cordyceps fumosorosea ARSEF 2679]|uniref:MFS general substrate transporter n=1 Tax=Cordyceps fumosorosea (strain ARSEF 2679) TaxID=1081104 RepID=A0A167AM02_CORFA|nr:MFS general substrate transporter [Cordyceps fumosorosea ARSEF 2679]OAA39052.1 MFS general substrate transporter [Cordyceps fumosorosea ARSEF 2679]
MSSRKASSHPVLSATKPVPVTRSIPLGDFPDHEPKPRWTAYLWDSLDKSPQERRFLFKIDAAILTVACLGYFIKNLDQVNVNNAFVSGMKEDLDLNGNELNYMQTCWTQPTFDANPTFVVDSFV